MVAKCLNCNSFIAYPDGPTANTWVSMYKDLFPQKCRCYNLYVDQEDKRITYDDSSVVQIWNTVSESWMPVEEAIL